MNDLPPQSQPWVREVDDKNAKIRAAIDRIRTNKQMQQRTTQANVNAAAVQVPVVASQVAGTQVQTFQSIDIASVGMSGTNGQYTTVGTYSTVTPLGRDGSVEYFTTATVVMNLSSAQGSLGAVRIGVNGNFSPAARFTTPAGGVFACTAFAGSVASTSTLTVTVQILLPNFAAVTGDTLVQAGLTGAWV